MNGYTKRSLSWDISYLSTKVKMQNIEDIITRLRDHLACHDVTLETYVANCGEQFKYYANRSKVNKWMKGLVKSDLIALTVDSWLHERTKDEHLEKAKELGIETKTGAVERVTTPNRKFANMMIDSDVNITLSDRQFTADFIDIPTRYRKKITTKESAGTNIYASLIWYLVYFDRNMNPSRRVHVSSIYRHDNNKRREQGKVLIPISRRYLSHDRMMQPDSSPPPAITCNEEYTELLRRSSSYSFIAFVDVENTSRVSDLGCIHENRNCLFVFYMTSWNRMCKQVREYFDSYPYDNIMYYLCSQGGEQSVDTELTFSVAAADIDMLPNTHFLIISGDSDLDMDHLSDRRTIRRVSSTNLASFDYSSLHTS